MRHRNPRRQRPAGAGRRVFILSILSHALLLLGLSPLLMVAGDASGNRPAVFASDVILMERPETPRPEMDAPPPAEVAELAPEPIEEQLEEPAEPPPLEPLREIRPLTAEITIPATWSVLARPKKEEAPPPRAAPPPPVIAPAVPARTAVYRAPAPRGPSRRAAPLAGNTKPRYPARAQQSGIEGVTLLIVSVGPDGSVGEVRVKRSSGSVILDREAVRAVKSWRFRPAWKHGQAVVSKVAVPIRFKLR